MKSKFTFQELLNLWDNWRHKFIEDFFKLCNEKDRQLMGGGEWLTIELHKFIGTIKPFSSLEEMKDESKRKNLVTEFYERIKFLITHVENEDFKRIHTNKKNKKWRDDLNKLAMTEFRENKGINKNKTVALKIAFEKLPDKEQHRAEFQDKDKFRNIFYRPFLRTFPKKEKHL